MPPQLKYKDYTIIWIAILPIEAEAAIKVLDRRHEGLFESLPGDDYLYIGGELNGHNIAIATLPAGQNYGVASAAALANQIKIRFTNVWFALLVGIAAGLPNLSLDESSEYRDIRLGDVLVAEPRESSTGIIHYDLGRCTDGGFQMNGRSAESPPILRSAFARMKLLYERPFKQGNVLAAYLQSLQDADGGKKFVYPDFAMDKLFEPSIHDEQETEVHRQPRGSEERTMVWYGNIGSGNSLMRSARQRDELRDRHDLIGLEMESAGIVNTLPTGVIRGVCDYGDKHKIKHWQPYAAAVAAVYAKGILNFIQPRNASRKRKLRDFQEDEYHAQQSELKQEDREILASLAFPRMRDRRLHIKRPHEGTCHWILDLPKYREWDAQPRGLLWIKGKPGAGKSTVMSFLYTVVGEKSTVETTTYLEFFFSARGEILQHSFTGMLRSLLNQLYHQDPRTRTPVKELYRKKQTTFGGKIPLAWEWQEEELKTILEDAILKSASHRQVLIFIDALDEAGEDVALAIAEYFHVINTQLAARSGTAKIYLSCRHYPIASEVHSTEICVEEYNNDDIRAYVEAQIHRTASCLSSISDQQQWQQLATDIVQQAKGVFQWVSLVLPIVTRSMRNGFTPLQTRQRLEKVPEELSNVYEHILRNVIDHENVQQSFLLFQWVCFAERPLNIAELRYALASYYASPSLHGSPSVRCCETNSFVTTDQAMKLQLKALSGGLVEDADNTVQVVHQTVKEFLMRNGLDLLEAMITNLGMSSTESDWIQTVPEALGLSQKCHARLYLSCLKYLATEWGNMPPKETGRYSAHETHESFVAISPFISYAMNRLFRHAKKAKNCHKVALSEQIGLIDQIRWLWKHLNYKVLLERDSCNGLWNGYYQMNTLHIAAAFGLDDLVRYLVNSGIGIDRRNGMGFNALRSAIQYKQETTVGLLLGAGANAEAIDVYGRTALLSAVLQGHEQMVRLLLLYMADVNARKNSGSTALMAAATRGHSRIVDLLLAHGAEIDAQADDNGGQTALMGAVWWGHEQVVRILLSHGADADLRDKYGRTALMTAHVLGHTHIVQLISAYQDGQNI